MGEEFEQIVRWRLPDSPSLSAYYEQARAGARFDLSHDVEHITSPTLVIHSSEDRYVPVANAVALAEAIPDSKLWILGDAGHLVFIERFADMNREVVRFLKPCRPRDGDGGRGGHRPQACSGMAQPWRRRSLPARFAGTLDVLRGN